LDAFEEIFFEVFGCDGRIIPHEVIPLAAEAVNEAENTEGAGTGAPAALAGMAGRGFVANFEGFIFQADDSVDGIFNIEHFSEVDVFVPAEFMGILTEERHQSDGDFHDTGGTDAEVQFRRLA
jgi:hypothetical protein